MTMMTMKSFTLHLVVVFILSVQYDHQKIGISCSSATTSSKTASASATTTRRTAPSLPAIITENTKHKAVASTIVAHDPINSLNNIRTVSIAEDTTLARNNNGNIVGTGRSINSNGSGSSSNSSINTIFHHHQKRFQRQQQTTTKTTKTSRTMHRLSGGYLTHKTENVNNMSPDNDFSTRTQLSRAYFRRKPNQNVYDSSYNNNNNTYFNKISKVSESSDIEDLNSDAALLEDPRELDNWDNGILRLSAGAGKENSKSKKKEESKKTLADQVRDGKYGLIEKEIFQNEPQRPGIISYLPNKEVPNDNSKTLGGLNKDDIWLAEDHLLVLKGGSLSDNNDDQPWEPIDDYEAPSRQIKIPSNPKVPPPFPVQFEDNGPIQIIGNHKFAIINPFINESLSIFGGDGSYQSPETNSDNEKNIVTGTRASKNSTKGKDNYFYTPPEIPWISYNQTFTNPFLNVPPILPDLKNGSLDNSTDYFDEDDPSLYYPPPYSFVYENNYSSPVAPGPLVPGIVLPPPPNAFARLEDKKTKSQQNTNIPFKQVLTRITEYKSKSVVITTTPSPSLSTTVVYSRPQTKDILYEVTKPTKKPDRIRIHTPPRQQLTFATLPPAPIIPQTSPPPEISFVSKVPSIMDTSLKGNPIYYEYFDARKPTIDQNFYVQQPPLAPQSRPYNKVQVNTVRTTQQPRLSKSYLPSRPSSNNEYSYITPKPEIRPNGIPDSYLSTPTKSSYKPYSDFDHEVNAIRQTLQFYKSQQLQQNVIPRVPRPKPVYEYSFDARNSNHNFNLPLQVDDEPFKPIVKYSQPVDDAIGFRAIPYTKSRDNPQQFEQDYYIQTSTPNQLQKTRVGAKTYIKPIIYTSTQVPETKVEYTNGIQQSIPNYQYTTNRLKGNGHPHPGWISIEKQIVEEIHPQTARISGQKHSAASSAGGYSKHTDIAVNKPFTGYYYNPSPPPRQNNRFYQIRPVEATFSRQVGAIKEQLRPYKLREPISLQNDTYVNYAPNKPPINPDAEFINPSLHHRQSIHAHIHPNGQPYSQRLTNNRATSYNNKPISLQRDILINYRQPLPPINPDSEYIQIQQPQSIHRNFQYSRIPPNEQTNVYYFQPPPLPSQSGR